MQRSSDGSDDLKEIEVGVILDTTPRFYDVAITSTLSSPLINSLYLIG